VKIYGVDHWLEPPRMLLDRELRGLRNELMAAKVEELWRTGECRTAALVLGGNHLLLESDDGTIVPVPRLLARLAGAQLRMILALPRSKDPPEMAWQACPGRPAWGARILFPAATDPSGLIPEEVLGKLGTGTPRPRYRNFPLSSLDALILSD
jgi:hypothetical protein